VQHGEFVGACDPKEMLSRKNSKKCTEIEINSSSSSTQNKKTKRKSLTWRWGRRHGCDHSRDRLGSICSPWMALKLYSPPG
jgi:hypothetical protein